MRFCIGNAPTTNLVVGVPIIGIHVQTHSILCRQSTERLGKIKVKVSLSSCTHAANLDFTFIEHDPHSRSLRACDRA